MKTPKIIYISGPITGIKNYKTNFKNAENRTRKLYPKATIINPTILPKGLSYEGYIHIDLAMVDCCDTIIMLDGWNESTGANLELMHALAQGKEIIYL